jgi:hypothetical protein
MRTLYILILLFLVPLFLFGQNKIQPDTSKHVAKLDTINPNNGDVKGQLKEIKANKILLHSDSIGPDSVGNQPHKSVRVDTTVQNKYGDLLDDDPKYNRRYPIWIPIVEGMGDNALLSLFDSKVFNYDWAQVSPASWKRNLGAGFPWSKGWVWDQTQFGNDFLGHPMFGSLYYNDARSNGYNFWESAPFALLGSYEWKICGENITPEKNSLIATTVDGICLGEILYRISSNLLDDRTTGANRLFREILATLIDPMREFNRLLQGKTSRSTNKEVYSKEPLNVTLYGGVNIISTHTNAIFNGSTTELLNLQLDYGNPFEVCNRTPFAFFKLKIETSFGAGRKFIDNVTGYGNLYAKNSQAGNVALLEGLFLYYDYWDNPTFELSTIGLGPSIFSKLPLGKNSNLYTNAHIGIVPFAGTSTEPISDTSLSRDFNFGYGWEAKFETSLSLGKVATIGVAYQYSMVHCINSVGQDEPAFGSLGNNNISILQPKITIRIYKDMSIGYEYYLYSEIHNNIDGYPRFASSLTEQKFFIQFYFEDPQRRGHYD